MSLVGLESVTFSVADLDAERKFLDDFGLIEHDSGRAGASFRTAEGASVEIRLAGDPGVPDPAGPDMGLREVHWGVSDRDALGLLADALSSWGKVEEDADGTIRSADPMGLSLAFSVSQIDRSGKDRTDENVARAPGRRAVMPERARPFHFGHVVLQGAGSEVETFYREALGFKISDWNPKGTFLRCSGSSNHHNLFLLAEGPVGIHHISFRVTGIDEIMVGKEHLEGRGWHKVWGPGRHPIGSQLFCYFAHPAGGLIEYHAGEDEIVDDNAWEPRHFDGPSSMAWGGMPG